MRRLVHASEGERKRDTESDGQEGLDSWRQGQRNRETVRGWGGAPAEGLINCSFVVLVCACVRFSVRASMCRFVLVLVLYFY